MAARIEQRARKTENFRQDEVASCSDSRPDWPVHSSAAISLCGRWHRAEQPLPGTSELLEQRPLDVVMVEGIDRFALREIETARQQRASLWNYDYTSLAAYRASLAPYRERFAERIGVVDQRAEADGIEFNATTTQSSLVAENDLYTVHSVSWPVLDGISAEGLFLQPKKKPVARVVAIPDADWTPEMITGLSDGSDSNFAGDLAAFGCEVLVPTLINRDHQFSANRIDRSQNQSHSSRVCLSPSFRTGKTRHRL